MASIMAVVSRELHTCRGSMVFPFMALLAGRRGKAFVREPSGWECGDLGYCLSLCTMGQIMKK